MFEIGDDGKDVRNGFGEIGSVVIGDEMIDDAKPPLDGLAFLLDEQVARVRIPFVLEQIVLTPAFDLFRPEGTN